MHAGERESALCKISGTRNRKSEILLTRSFDINFAVFPLHYALRPFFMHTLRHMILSLCAAQVRTNKNTAVVTWERVCKFQTFAHTPEAASF